MLVALALVVFSQASDYPKVIRKDGQVCVQTLGSGGKVEESCRSDSTEYKPPAAAVREPLSADSPVAVRRLPRPEPSSSRGAPSPSAMFWATSKQHWALACKIGAISALTSALVAIVGAVVVGGSGVPRAAEPYLATAGVAGAFTVLFAVAAVMFDRSGHAELVPEESE